MSDLEPLSTHDRLLLERAIKRWRAEAVPAGPQHSLWDCIFDAEAALEGRPTLLPIRKIVEMCRGK